MTISKILMRIAAIAVIATMFGCIADHEVKETATGYRYYSGTSGIYDQVDKYTDTGSSMGDKTQYNFNYLPLLGGFFYYLTDSTDDEWDESLWSSGYTQGFDEEDPDNVYFYVPGFDYPLHQLLLRGHDTDGYPTASYGATADRPSQAAGKIYANTETNLLEFSDGTAWQTPSGVSAGVSGIVVDGGAAYADSNIKLFGDGITLTMDAATSPRKITATADLQGSGSADKFAKWSDSGTITAATTAEGPTGDVTVTGDIIVSGLVDGVDIAGLGSVSTQGIYGTSSEHIGGMSQNVGTTGKITTTDTIETKDLTASGNISSSFISATTGVAVTGDVSVTGAYYAKGAQLLESLRDISKEVNTWAVSSYAPPTIEYETSTTNALEIRSYLFDDNAYEKIISDFPVPDDCDLTQNISLTFWLAPRYDATGDVVLQLGTVEAGPGEDPMSQAMRYYTQTYSYSGATLDAAYAVTFPITGTNLAVDDTVFAEFQRCGPDGSDSLSGKIRLRTVEGYCKSKNASK